MLKRLATLLLGIGLIGLGVLFFLAPEQAFVVRVLVHYWPVFLILAGVVRVAGYLIDHHPRSPVGGMMITAIGGILLAANLRGNHSLIHLFGQYWFWLLLAYIAGRVLRQYTHRLADGPRPRAFSPGAVMLMILLVGGGLAANFLTKNNQYLNRLNVPLKFAGVSDYLFGDQIAIEDAPQTFVLAANARLLINNLNGDVEINSAPQTQATARLIKRIRATSEEEAKQVAQKIYLQIASANNSHQFRVNAPAVTCNATLIITLPQNLAAGVEATDIAGLVKLSNLRGEHTIRNGARIQINNNIGAVTIDSPRGAVELSQIQGAVNLRHTSHNVLLREVAGAMTIETEGGSVEGERLSGPVQVRASNARLELNEIAGDGHHQPLVKLEEISNSHVKLTAIKGNVTIDAERSRIEAEEITGDLAIKNTQERITVNHINGALRINADNGAVEIEEITGAAEIAATRDVTVRDFHGPLNVKTRQGAIAISTNEKLAGDCIVVSEQGRIRASLPEDSSFKLQAETEQGRLRLRGFDELDVPRRQRQFVADHKVTGAAPRLVLHSTRGNIELQSSGLALASHDDDEHN